MRINNIVIIMVVLHASAAFMAGTGIAADLGVYPNPGADGPVDTAINDARDYTPQDGGGGTLFGLIFGAVQTIASIFGLAVAFPLMLGNLGVPDVILAFIFAPLYLLIAFDLVNLALRADLL